MMDVMDGGTDFVRKLELAEMEAIWRIGNGERIYDGNERGQGKVELYGEVSVGAWV